MPFLLRYGSRDTRRVDFPRVDGLSTDTSGLGRHTSNSSYIMTSISFLTNYKFALVSCKIFGFLNFHISHLNYKKIQIMLTKYPKYAEND